MSKDEVLSAYLVHDEQSFFLSLLPFLVVALWPKLLGT